MRKPIMVGNWKMNTTSAEATALVTALKTELNEVTDVEIGVCPPFVYIQPVKQLLQGSNIKTGAQNVYWESKGAFTGQVSPGMLKDIGCDYVLVGHSECRHVMGETDEVINKKIKVLLAAGLTPIFCVGEKLEQRQDNTTENVIRAQVEQGLNGVPKEKIKEIIVAYEPVWAIGTGKTATPEQAQEVHSFIRKLISLISNEETAQGMRIMYGGSVKPDNIKGLMAKDDIDGALVGGASLKADSFVKLVKYQ